MPRIIIFAVLCYVIGSMPFGLWLSKHFGVNLQEKGSKNIGATNVARVMGKKLGALTLVLDAGKAALAVLMAQYFINQEAAPYFALLFVILGHCFSCFLGFKGGKGVASFLGGVLALNWALGLVALGSWLLMYLIQKTSSVSALFMLMITVIAGALMLPQVGAIIITALALIITIRHKQNVLDLIDKKQ